MTMRPYHKKWRTARDLYVYNRKPLSYISYHLRIPEDVLHRWCNRYDWNEMRAAIYLRPQNLAGMYLQHAEQILEEAHINREGLNIQDLKRLNYLNQGIAVSNKDISLNKQAQVLENYMASLQAKEHRRKEIRNTVLDYLQQQLNAHHHKTTAQSLVATLKRSVNAVA